MVSFILPGNSASGGYDVANSLRFNSGSSDYLNHETGNSTTSSTKTTLSAWVKRSSIGNNDVIFGHEESNSLRSAIYINDDDNFLYFQNGSNIFLTNAKFRDTSAWYHFVVTSDLTQATASNRVKLYINGVQETSFATESYPSQNASNSVPNFGNQTIGVNIYNSSPSSSNYFDGYMAEVCFIDGQALDPTSFGKFDSDTNIWKPIDVSGLTFGKNGFYLDFEDSSALGNDANGSNNFTVNNLTAIDQSTDTCTNNFATLNVLDGNLGNSTFSEGSLRFNSEDGANKCWMRSTIGVSSGKWYFEAKVQTAGNNCAIGISDRPSPDFNSTELGAGAFDYSYQSANSGNKLNNGSGSSYGDTYTDDDIVSCALDLDNNKVYFGKNGTFQNSGNPTNGTNPAFTITAPSLTNHGFYFFCLGDLTGVNNVRWLANFGSPPYSESGGNSDGNGYGNFAGSVPSGYYALNTKNLAEYG